MLPRKLIYAIGSCLIAASIQSVAKDAYQFGDEEMLDMSTLSKPEVIAESDIFLAEPVGIEGLKSMNVRIITSGGKLVFDEQTDGGPVSLFITELNLPDGQYRYEVNAVYDIGSSGNGFISPFTSSRDFGTFTIQGGLIENSRANAVTGEDSVSDNNDVSWPVRFAASALDWLIADASAANSGDAAHDNTCVGDAACDDTSLPQSTTSGFIGDFTILDATTLDADFLFGNSEGTLLFNIDNDIFTIFDDDTSLALMELNFTGDVTLGNGSVFIDESNAAMNIGSTAAPVGNLQVTGNTSGVAITMLDTVNSEANIFIQDGDRFMLTYGLSTVPFQIENAAPSNAFVIGSSGNIGIGTLTPGSAVDVQRSAAAASFQLTSFTDTANQAPQFVQRRSRGSSGTPLAVGLNDNLGLISFRGYTGSGFTGTKATVAAQATENWTPTANGTRLIFGTTENGTTGLTAVLEITHDGKVKINGTTLTVPDYVFEEDYELMSLDELSAYIKENKHLPGVAAASEVNVDGLDIAGSQLSVLEKVEELTLYTIQQHEQLTQLKAENIALQEKVAKVDQLEQMVSLLMQRSENDKLLTTINQ